MKILAIQHDAAGPPAAAGEIVEDLGHSLETICIHQEDPIPETVEADMLMMFGGGLSLADEDLPPWVAQEQALVRRYVDEGRRVVGMCLGGQMIASALGATVHRNNDVEVGWHPVSHVDAEAILHRDLFPNPFTALSWHQDTFDIPTGAKHILRSDACKNQAFVIDDRVFGFQFHLEANERTVMTFNKISPLRKKEGPYVQPPQGVQEGIEKHLAAQISVLRGVLEKLCG